jgi:hypothetical protein
MITINSLPDWTSLTNKFFSFCSAFCHQENLFPFARALWTSHDTPTCYFLSHCQFEHPVYLGTPSVAMRCLHSYQHLHCDYSVWVVTLCVLELVQLADKCSFIVMCLGSNISFGWTLLMTLQLRPFFLSPIVAHVTTKNIYFPLLSPNELLTTLAPAICCPTASSNTLYISVHHQ